MKRRHDTSGWLLSQLPNSTGDELLAAAWINNSTALPADM